MNRRSLLQLLGLAPVAAAAPQLLSASTLGTHPVVNVPNIQCGRCAGAMAFEPFKTAVSAREAFSSREPVLAKCYECGVIVAVPIPFIDCRVAARDSD